MTKNNDNHLNSDHDNDHDNGMLESLNSDQEKAVLYLDSPLLVIAGAGSGKTKVITHKIAYLVREKGYTPDNILGVTFTNKAANEMKNRIQTITGIDAGKFNISTFHSLGLRILRQAGTAAGFDAQWQVIDDQDQKKIIDRIIKENFSYYTNDMRDEVKRKIGFAKMNLHYPNDSELLFEEGFSQDQVDVFSLYYNFQKKNKLWDYEDLVSLPVLLLQTNEPLRQKYVQRFRYVLVDEFQDTNPNQYEMVRLIAGDHQNITIVGDDDQAIYSWRGASIRYLLNFQEDFPNAHIVKLQQNYRSTPQVLNFANSLIKKNTYRREKAMWTEKKKGNPVYVLNSKSKEDEAAMAAAYIIRLRQENPELFPVAVLYRINSQSLSFETAFAKRGINFKILKGIRFFDRKEVKDSLALLKLALNPHDDISFLRLIDFLPVGIGPKTLRELSSTAKKENLSLFETLRTVMPDKFNAREIFTLLDSMNREKDNLKLSDMLETLLNRAAYREFLKSRGEQHRLLNIDELQEYLKNWEAANPGESFGLLMDRISLDSGDIQNNGNGENEIDVFMLTMHNAKGLEFPTIFASGINSSYMPFFLRKERVEIEEERRLLYVTATRAVKQLIISVGAQKPSRFLSEVSRSLYSDVFSVDDLFDYLPTVTHRTLPESGIEQEHREEKYLEHPIFGRGRIVNVIDKEKYVVDFAEKGEKTIDTSIVSVTFL